MRRALLALLSAMVLALAAIGPAAAAKPVVHERFGPPPPLTLTAGDVCNFAVTLATQVDRSKTSVWELEDGTVRVLVRGFASGTATANGLTYTHSGGFRIEIVFHPNGSADVSASGALFAWYMAGEPVVGLSKGLFAINGHGTESYDANGSLVAARFHGGHVVDLCAALTPAGG